MNAGDPEGFVSGIGSVYGVPCRSSPWLRHSVLYITGLLAAALIWFLLQGGRFLTSDLNTPPKGQVDLLVILGGGWKFREITGLELVRSGRAARVLLTGVPERRGNNSLPIWFPRYRFLVEAGVDSRGLLLDSSAENTWDEVFLVREMAVQNSWHSILIVTDPPHLRRLDWVCRKLLRPTGIHYELVATQPDWWDSNTWWRDRIAARFVFTEYAKLFYYWFRYSGAS